MAAGPLTPEAIALICEHMNDDHADALVGYVRTFAGHLDAHSARMAALDETGMDLDVQTEQGVVPVRIVFDHTLVDANDAQQTLIAMARNAG